MIHKTSIFFVLLSLFLLEACQSEPAPTGAAAYIPSGASSVISFDLGSIARKVGQESLSEIHFVEGRESENPGKIDYPGILLDDPATSGIDLNDRIYVATELHPLNPRAICNRLLVPLSSTDKFEKALDISESDIRVVNGWRTVQAGNGTVLAWNDQVFTVSYTTAEEWKEPNESVNWVTDQNEKKTMWKGQAAKDLMASHDISGWISTRFLAENPSLAVALNMFELDPALLEDNHIQLFGDLESGKMKGTAQFQSNRAFRREIIERLFKEKGMTDFSGILPKAGLSFAGSFALNPVGIDKFLSVRPQSKEYADFALDNIGMPRKDILELFNGDMLIASYGDNPGDKGNLVLALGVKDLDKTQAFLTKAVADKKMKEEAPGIFKLVKVGGEDFSITKNKGLGKFMLHDDILLFTTNGSLLTMIQEKLSQPGEEKASFNNQDQTIAGWMDLKSVQQNMNNRALFEKMSFQADFSGGDFVLETSDAEVNILKSILLYFQATQKKNDQTDFDSL